MQQIQNGSSKPGLTPLHLAMAIKALTFTKDQLRLNLRVLVVHDSSMLSLMWMGLYIYSLNMSVVIAAELC